MSSQEICKACVLLEGLNRGLPRLGIGKSSKIKKMLAANNTPSNSTTNLKYDGSDHTNNEAINREEKMCDNTDRKCLCRGPLTTTSGRNSELNKTRELIKQLELL